MQLNESKELEVNEDFERGGFPRDAQGLKEPFHYPFLRFPPESLSSLSALTPSRFPLGGLLTCPTAIYARRRSMCIYHVALRSFCED